MTSGLAQVSNSRLIGSSLCISHLAGNQAVAANIAIRPYRSNDHAEVVALLKAVFPEDPPWNVPASRAIDSAAVKRCARPGACLCGR
jgi:hypothetical protein